MCYCFNHFQYNDNHFSFQLNLGHSPHFAVLVISAVSGLSCIAKEHLALATLIDIPIVIVINKVDLATPTCLNKTLCQLESLLKTPGYVKVNICINSLLS